MVEKVALATVTIAWVCNGVLHSVVADSPELLPNTVRRTRIEGTDRVIRAHS